MVKEYNGYRLEQCQCPYTAKAGRVYLAHSYNTESMSQHWDTLDAAIASIDRWAAEAARTETFDKYAGRRFTAQGVVNSKPGQN